MVVLQEGRALGAWIGVVWDPRRALPAHAIAFVEQLAAAWPAGRTGRERGLPPVPKPPLQEASTAFR